MRTNSLSFRLIFTSAVVAVVLLVSAAFLLAYLFQQALERNFDARLRAILDGLLANVELATDGSPFMSGRIPARASPYRSPAGIGRSRRPGTGRCATWLPNPPSKSA